MIIEQHILKRRQNYSVFSAEDLFSQMNQYEKFCKDLFSQIEIKEKIWGGFIFTNQSKCKKYAGIFYFFRSKQYNVLNQGSVSFGDNSPGARGHFWDDLVGIVFGGRILLKTNARSFRISMFVTPNLLHSVYFADQNIF